MMFRFAICFLLAVCAAILTRSEVIAGDSAGSHAYVVSTGSSHGGYAYGSVLPRRDIRVARREARQADRQARWDGSSGSYGCYGSSGSVGMVAEAEPVIVEVPVVVEVPVSVCPTGHCGRRVLIAERRRIRIIE